MASVLVVCVWSYCGLTWCLYVFFYLGINSGVVGTSTFLSGSEYMWSYINKTGAFRQLPTSEPTKQDKTKL